MENKHFIQFLNQIGLTINEMAGKLNISYTTARNRIEMLDFTIPELIKFSQVTTIPIEQLVLIIIGKKPIKDAIIPYALTKEIAVDKLCEDPDFLRIVLECKGSREKIKTVSMSEINALKRAILQNKNNQL